MTLNAYTQHPGFILSHLTQKQIQGGFELHVDLLIGTVFFEPREHVDFRGVFKGQAGINAAYDELAYVQELGTGTKKLRACR